MLNNLLSLGGSYIVQVPTYLIFKLLKNKICSYNNITIENTTNTFSNLLIFAWRFSFFL